MRRRDLCSSNSSFTPITTPTVPAARCRRRRAGWPLGMLAALMAVATAVGCADPAAVPAGVDPQAIEGTLAVLVIDELEVLDECDASNGSPGDFYVSARVTDDSAGKQYPLGGFQSHLVSSHIATTALDLEVASAFFQDEGRALGFAVGYNEFDGGSSYDGQAARAHRYTWQPAERCWLDFTETHCLAPGEGMRFELPLNEDPGASCRATLRYGIELMPVTHPAAYYAGGRYEGYPLMSSFGRLPKESMGASPTMQAECDVSGPIEVVIDHEAETEVTGHGECKSAGSYTGFIGFDVKAAFTSDRDIAGTITFEVHGLTVAYPVEGHRTLNTIQFTFAGRATDPTDAAYVFEAAGGFQVDLE